MQRRLRTALTLSWYDWWNLTQAWILLLAVDLGLRVLPFRRVQRFAAPGRKGKGDLSASEAAATIRNLRRLVDIAGHNHLYPMTCLRGALVLRWLLGGHGIAVDLRIAVHRKANELEAHAWLEYDGQPIGEPQTIPAGYTPLVSLEAD